jgi:NADH-quinone oxidoreductase subunit L
MGYIATKTSFLAAILGLPLFLVLAAVVLFFAKKQSQQFLKYVVMLCAVVMAVWSGYLVYVGLLYKPVYSFLWFDFGKPVTISFGLDFQGSLMLGMVAFITLLVVMYSTAYMQHEKGYARYFACLFLFVASMIGIVLSFNLLLTFVFWELVGFCSYLLINFWYKKDASNQAARKAFILNRVGDLGFLMGLGLLYAHLGTFEIGTLSNSISPTQNSLLFWAGLGVFLGCVGKSAQFPLLGWLPDAMQAPTPISALLHAATMVAAGVFLLARLLPLFPSELLTIIAYVGAITSFIGAFAACSQTDIKKILAYSTVSQLGYMVAALGTGAYFASILHLFTHAIFKACLFLCAGAIIHAMSHLKTYSSHDFDAQDIRFMGGLRKQMPLTFLTFLVASFASAGIPFSAGFLSKDEILLSVVSWTLLQNNTAHYVLMLLIFATSFMTVFYTGRLVFTVFFGEFRLAKAHQSFQDLFKYLHEPPKFMLYVCLVLVPFCLFVVFSTHPFNVEASWLYALLPNPRLPLLPDYFSTEMFQMKKASLHLLVVGVSLFLISFALGLSYLFYGSSRKANFDFLRVHFRRLGILNLSYNAFYVNYLYEIVVVRPFDRLSFFAAEFDKKWIDKSVERSAIFVMGISHFLAWFDKWVVDGSVAALIWTIEAVGTQLKKLQNGKVQSYLVLAFAAVLAFLIFLVF